MKQQHTIESLLEHSQWVHAFARTLVAAGDVDDLAQDTLTAALQAPWEALASRHSAKGWLATAARNIARTRQRGSRHRQDRERSVAQAHFQDTAAQERYRPEAVLARSELQRSVIDAVLGLEEPYRRTLLLRFVEGLSPAEIAVETGTKASTVRTHVARGIEKVRERLDEESGGDRERWILALLPLAHGERSAPVVGASVAAGAGLGIAAKVLLCLFPVVALLGWWAWRAPVAFDDSGAVAGQALVAKRAAVSSASTAKEGPGASRGTTLRKPVAPQDEPTGEPAVEQGLLTVLDERTGQSLPFFRFEETYVRRSTPRMGPRWGPGGGHLLTTDGLGVIVLPTSFRGFTSRDAYEGQALAAELFGLGRGGAGEPQTVIWVDGRATLRVPPVATVRLNSSALGGMESSRLLASLARPGQTLRFGAMSDVRRDAKGHYLRFPHAFETNGNDLQLNLFTADGLRLAQAPLAEHRDGTSTWIPGWEPRASLAGVVTRSGEPSAAPLHRIELWKGAHHIDAIGPGVGLGGARARWSDTRVARPAPGNSTYEFILLESGIWTLLIHELHSKPFAQVVELVAGQAMKLDVDLEDSGLEFRALEGQLTSRTGQFRDFLEVHAVDSRPNYGSYSANTRVEWATEDGRQVGRFRFEHLACVPHNLYFHSDRGRVERGLLPRGTYTVTPGQDLEIELRDEVAGTDIRVSARDAKTGEPVEDFVVQALLWKPESAGESTDWRYESAWRGAAQLRGLRSPEDWSLVVMAPGYQIARLPKGVLTDRKELTVDLSAGWGCILAAVNEGFDLNLEGVEFYFDGVRVATPAADLSNPNTSLPIVNRTSAPNSVEARLDGWSFKFSSALTKDCELNTEHQLKGGQILIIMAKDPAVR